MNDCSEFSVREFKHSSSFSILSYIISAFPAWVYYAYIMFRTFSGHFTLGQFFLLCAAVENFIAYTQNFASMLSQMNREALTLEHHREFRRIKSEIIDDTRRRRLTPGSGILSPGMSVLIIIPATTA